MYFGYLNRTERIRALRRVPGEAAALVKPERVVQVPVAQIESLSHKHLLEFVLVDAAGF